MGRRFLSLLFILFSLTSCISAAIFGGSKAPAAASPAGQRADSLGVISSALQCRKKFFHKMVIYATIREACVLMQAGRTIRGECKKPRVKQQQANGCQFYPQKFEPTSKLKFESYSKRGAQLFSFPLLQFGDLYDGSTSPGLERVIFDIGCNAAGATTADTLRGYTEACVLNRSPPKQGFFNIQY